MAGEKLSDGVDDLERLKLEIAFALEASDLDSASAKIDAAELLLALTPNFEKDGYNVEWRDAIQQLRASINRKRSASRGVVRTPYSYSSPEAVG